MAKYNHKETWADHEKIMADKPKVEFTSQDIGKEVAKIIKRMPVNPQTLSLLRFLKKKYDK